MASTPASRVCSFLIAGSFTLAMLLLYSQSLALQAQNMTVPLLSGDTTRVDTTDRFSREALEIPARAASDTLETPGDTTAGWHLIERYQPTYRLGSPLQYPHRTSLFRHHLDPHERRIEADSLAQRYALRFRVGTRETGPVFWMDRHVYQSLHRAEAMEQNWQDLERERRLERERQERGGVGVNVAIPGGPDSPFSTIFGSPEVDLRVTGNANLNTGLNYRHSDQQSHFTGSATQIDPNFQQDLRLGISGAIGDKLLVDVNWDTNNQFDFQNQVRLQYTGYENEILQSVEAGNVFLRTPSSLIRGGQSLFGIKSEMQLGGLSLTTVASQQEGQTGSLMIEGGSERTTFSLRPTEYDDRTHFFLGYYFRNRWETALASPPNIQLEPGFNGVTDIEVWKLQTSANPEDDNVRSAVAVVDLGEPREILSEGRDFAQASLSLFRPEADQYSDADLNTMRNPGTSRSFFEAKSLRESDYETGYYRRLERGRDYDIDSNLGYISLRQRLQESEALAVSFRFTHEGQNYEIGDLTEAGGSTGGIDSERMVLKLLRPAPPTQPSSGQGVAAWHLQMRNIYPLRGRNLDQGDFELDIVYDPPAQTPLNRLDDITGSATFLHSLGLDRLTSDGAERPDDQFDFLPGVTISPQRGLLIFPYLEPFGSRIADLIGNHPDSASLRERYVFDSLYEQRRDNAERDTDLNVYRIEGAFSGAGQDFYDLRAIGGLVEGSVRVTSGGQVLHEGSDFSVDYQGGTVTILNENHLRSGRTLNIDYEQNALYNIQQKTLLGARADYSVRDDVSLGATLMRMSERSPVDKYRLGEEPVSNTIWGLDGAIDTDSPWLTRALDALPLLQTSASSQISLSAEFAQLRPGHGRTTAYNRARRSLRDQGRDFAPDEQRGVSYIDDFEGFENSFSLTAQPRAWQISSAPATYRPPGMEDMPDQAIHDSLRTRWRGALGWYQLNQSVVEELSGKAEAFERDAVRLIDINEVFPNRDTRGEINTTLRTLDLYFDPHLRGPYNYQDDLQSFFNRPERTWGGMIRRLPDGYTDFSVQNVEFVEFIFKPFPENSQRDAGSDAALYLNLGSISEDIIGNERLSTEDGLSLSNFSAAHFDGPFRLATRQQIGAITIEEGRTNDLGIDGLVSYDTNCYDAEGRYTVCDYPEIVTEHFQFRDYLSRLRSITSTNPLAAAEVRRTLSDPSADEYHHYANDEFFQNEDFFPGGASFQQRFTRYHSAMELNTFEGQSALAQNTTLARGITRQPATEDLNRNGVLDQENGYFQYRIPLSRDSLRAHARNDDPDSYIVGEIQAADGTGTGWYQVRIPVRRYTEAVGNIQDFSMIEDMRLWTTGHQVPITMRFAKMDLVGSQWRSSDRVPLEENELGEPLIQDGSDESPLFIASVNNEENSDVYVPPPGAIIGQQQTATGTLRNAREQSMVLRVEDLAPGHQRAVSKTFTQGLNLLRYSNLRMFTRMNGQLADGTDLAQLANYNRSEARDKARLFVRIGSNQTSDYYEYEQPLTPSRTGHASADSLWLPDENQMNLVLSALNQLKVARDDAGYAPHEVFRSDQPQSREAGGPDPSLFAPSGTTLAIRGNPSLQTVTTIVIGVRNPATPATGQTLRDVTLWLDELRVSGYDDQSGWAALADTDIRLADIGRISANIRTQTDGFGSLESTLSQRNQDDVMDWSLTADLNAGRFLLDQYGWHLPLTFQIQSRTSTPRFSPERGDVRLEEIFAQIDANTELSAEEKHIERQRVLQRSQNHRQRQSITASIQKTGSDSWLLRNTLDRLSLNYSFSSSDARSPSRRIDDGWNWNTGLQYRLNTDQRRTLPLFGFLGPIPLLTELSGIEFNFMPQSLTMSGSAGRRFNRNQSRSGAVTGSGAAVPEQLRSQHDFSHDRRMTLQYNPFRFLNLNFSTSTAESLNAISADTAHVVTSINGGQVHQQTFASAHQAYEHAQSAGPGTMPQNILQPIPANTLVQQLLGGRIAPRPNRHEQRMAATLRLPLFNRRGFDWISVEDIGYQATFRWNNGPLGQASGASAENRLEMRSGVTLHPRRLWERVGIDTSPRLQEEDEPFFSPAGWGRQLVMSFLRIEDLSISYTGNRGARANHVGRAAEDGSMTGAPYSLFDALQGSGPSVGYRFGLAQSIPLQQRIMRPGLNVQDGLSGGNRLQARTRLAPSSHLQINLNWDLNWNDNRTTSYAGNEPIQTGGGDHRGSIWAFGASYENLVARQFDLLEQNLRNPEEPDVRTALTNRTLTEDFQETFTTSLGGPLDGRGLMLLPMPSWNVSYTGLSNWPLLNSLTRSITLRHNYNGEVQNNYYLNASNTVGEITSFRLGTTDIAYERADFRAGGLAVMERFQPLIGLDISWQNDIQTNISWNVSRAYRLSTGNSEVTQNEANELSISANYRKRGLSLPFIPGRLENQLNVNVTFSLQHHDERRFSVRRAMEQALANRGDFHPRDALHGDSVSPLRETMLYRFTPRIGYQLSNRVQADFLLEFERLEGDSRHHSYTHIDGGFSIQVDIAN